MNIVKMTRNGQVTIPVEMRKGIETNYYICEQSSGGILFKPVTLEEEGEAAKFTIEDLRNWSFKSKNPEERNLGGKIDKILYGS